MAAAIGAVGLAAIAWPRCFAGVAGNYMGPARVDPSDRERLRRVLQSREQMEGISGISGRYLGAACLFLAALEAVKAIPVIVPYVLFCLAIAVQALFAYVQFHRTVERRVAPLVRRSPLTALSPLVIVAMACSLAITLVLAVESADRLDAIVVALSTLILASIAWRVAGAPALLAGADPQLEYAVDERVRIGRARNVAAVACAPAILLVASAAPSLPSAYHAFAAFAPLFATLAFLVSIAAAQIPLRARIRAA
jgi:hypothetical protein